MNCLRKSPPANGPGQRGLSLRAWQAGGLAVLVLTAFTGLECIAQCKAPAGLKSTVEKQPSALAYVRLGSWFGGHQQFDCADQAFHSALSLNPASAEIYFYLGLNLNASGHPELALEPLKQSVALDSAAAQAHLLLANVLQQLGLRSEAEEQWSAVLTLDPASFEALDGLSNSLIDANDPDSAIHLLLPLRQKGELSTGLAVDLARAYGVARRLDDAAAVLQEGLAHDPASLQLTNALTTVYVRQKRFQDAEVRLKAYLDRHPEEVEAQILYLRILVLNEAHAAAAPLGRKLLRSAPHDFDVLYLNGILERETGEYEAARNHLREAVALRPGDYSARYNYGAVLMKLHDATGAREQLEKAAGLDGSQAEAHFQLAQALRAQGEASAAQDQMNIYRQLSSADDQRARAATQTELAAQKLEAGDAPQAARLYREALAATPEDPTLQYSLAIALRQSGDPAGERNALEETIKIDPNFALAQNQLGYLDFQNGAYLAAEEHFHRAVTSAPAFTDAWISLAATLASEKRLAEAREAVASALRLDPKNVQALQLAQDLNAVERPSKVETP